jgi:hypothetical protein
MSSISEMERREQDHLGEPNGMICPHCGLPADRQQNGIQGYRCGSSYCETFRPQWARSMTCLELQNGQLLERIQKLESLASLGGPSVKFYPLDPPFGTAAKEAKP